MAGSVPRRARHLIPAGLPHGREVIAACAVLVLLAHVLFAQLTLALAVVFTVISVVSRWRLWWLMVPVAVGLVMTLVTGPGHAAAGFAAGPSHVLGYLRNGYLPDRLRHPLGAFASAGRWLPGQLPIALITGAAEAAATGWLLWPGWLHWPGWPGWPHADEPAARTPRPGVIAAIRGALAARAIRAGAVVTRDGCALGVVKGTGAIAELRWPQIAGGVLVAGASAQEATVTSLQLVHAALRRRKPLVVIDAGADAVIARVLEAACVATGTPLRLADDTDLGAVIAERSAVLAAAGSPERVAKACGDIAALADDLRRIGVDGDALVWVPGAERVPPQWLAALIRSGAGAGLAVLMTTASPVAATELAGAVGALVIHRITDPVLAASLAARTGARTGARLPPGDAGTATVTRAAPVPVASDSPPASPGNYKFQDGGPLPGRLQDGGPLPGLLQEGGPLPGQFQDRDPLPGRFQDGGPLPGRFGDGGSSPGPFRVDGPLPGRFRDGGPLPGRPQDGGPLSGQAPPIGGGRPPESLAPRSGSGSVVTARVLLSLGPSEFVVIVSGPGGRLVERGRLVSARLPRRAAGSGVRL